MLNSMSRPEMNKVIITGGTGFIGRSLTELLLQAGYDVVCLTRTMEKAWNVLNPRVRPVLWDGRSSDGWLEEADGAFGVINLAGSSLGAERWSRSVRERIVKSRVNAGGAVAEAVNLAKHKPEVIIQASAIGYYPHNEDQPLTEESRSGEGFLSWVCRKWEDSVREAASGVRLVIIRTGLVLGDGGLLNRMVIPIRFYVGGPLGSGSQWMSWIHLQDECRAILFLLENRLEGVFNLTAPGPVRNKEFCRTLAKVLNRPCWLPAPSPALKLLFGRMAEEAVLSSQRVVSRRLKEGGFSFRFPELGPALFDIYGQKTGEGTGSA